MDAEIVYGQLKEIALTRFSGLVSDAFMVRGPLYFPRCLRIIFNDHSFMEVRLSEQKYSFHYDRRHLDGRLFRLDNAPHYREIKTYPEHFHKGNEENVEEDTFGKTFQEKFVAFMEFIEKLILK